MTRIALISAMGGGTVACSSDASRLGEPFSNPFSSSEPSATGSLGDDGEAVPTRAPAIRTPRIQSEALAAPSGSMTPRSIPSSSPSTPMASGSVSGMNPSGMNPSGMNPGGMNPDAGRGKKASAPAPAMTPRASAPQPKLHFVQGAKPAEKPVKVAEIEAKPAAKPVAETKPAKVEPKPVAKVAEKPAVKATEAKPAKAEAKVDAKLEAKKAEAARKEAEVKAAKADAAKEATGNAAKKVAEAKAAEAAAKAASKDAAKEAKRAAKETPAPVKIASADPVAPIAAAPVAAPAAAANEAFRWPAKGRIINAYGTSGNEGINIAVPEGTPVKAAEEGTVAYAGSDVKGYGKLVLVRHNNGYVSAYAHNGELDVKPGEKVKRGQVIAKSGATGNVTSPQLHFEIRKGATPVDPMPHLGG